MAAEGRVSETVAISVEEAGELLVLGRSQAYEAALHGRLPCYRVVGRGWRCSRRQTVEWFEERCRANVREPLDEPSGSAAD